MHGIDRGRVERSFHRGAGQYDQHTPVQQRVVQRLLDRLSAELPNSPQRVLDIGCGTGHLLQRLAQQYPQAGLTGLDLASNMLQQAAERLGTCAELLQGDAERLPAKDNSFDLVVSTSTFQWLEDCATCFGEVQRVLEPGGLFCFALFGDGTQREPHRSWREALQRNNRPVQQGGDGTHRFHTVDQVRQSLEQQGFVAVEVITQQELVWYPDLPQLLQAIKRIGAGTTRPQRGGGLGWRRVLHDMATVYRERYGTDLGVPASYQVIYGVGRS
jgi:malonyl-CoA O-methyltransferase